jgi:hypothetical protein
LDAVARFLNEWNAEKLRPGESQLRFEALNRKALTADEGRPLPAPQEIDWRTSGD